MRRPFLQNQIVEITLRTPRDPSATRSNWEFSHQNGEVEANLFDEMPEPTLIIDGDGQVTEVEPEAEDGAEPDPAA